MPKSKRLNHNSKIADVIRHLSLQERTKINERNNYLCKLVVTRLHVTRAGGSARSVMQSVYDVATLHAAKLTAAKLKKNTIDAVTANKVCSHNRQHNCNCNCKFKFSGPHDWQI